MSNKAITAGENVVDGKCAKCSRPGPRIYDVFFGRGKGVNLTVDGICFVPICDACCSRSKWSSIGMIVLAWVGIIVVGNLFFVDVVRSISMFLAIAGVLGIGVFLIASVKSYGKGLAGQIWKKKIAASTDSTLLNVNEEYKKQKWQELNHLIMCPRCHQVSSADLSSCSSCNVPLPKVRL